jgi:hypothetical protein
MSWMRIAAGLSIATLAALAFGAYDDVRLQVALNGLLALCGHR